MTEDFVPFELAEKLMLKGFNNPCIAYYDEGCLLYNTKYPFALTAEELFISHNSEYTWVDAPAISQVLKWLREEKRIHICMGYSDNLGFPWDYEVVLLDGAMYQNSESDFLSYEAAAIAGITWALDNLI